MTHRILSPFGKDTTALEIVQNLDLAGKRALITGAASGIGMETARALATVGAEVYLAVRNTEVGEQVSNQLRQETGNNQIFVLPLDLADQNSVQSLVSNWQGALHILINNAGVMAIPESHNAQGWECQFATNYMGHFALSLGLHSALKQEGARVVSLSSASHQLSPVVFEDIHYEIRPYDPFSAYGQSKSANALFAVEAAKRWATDNITVNVAAPGIIATNLQRHIGGLKVPEQYRKTPQQGAATSVWAAVSPLLEGVSGRYFADCNEAEVMTQANRENRFEGISQVAPWAIDATLAARLWNVSLELLAGVKLV
ncbi:SDR family NAD(P)-dependent oxidoreductase [Bisgaard Taxon 10/6]|uniref:SDR family NAD(P)-dependent oxidoreductase n=1 Tax=Exercitatus varius TaxID=67857 RepID=A0ABT6EQK5_9PAST|nr:SDR family NAD(P)-dependent oxidoreductase [Exercitatus varius]MDG2938968.1 SDR family NAD(P)-dependent oxidoreductase [Exercitatus varius]MDG2945834.1 SDR family NAD(P)-dependent oxidoreductase [Exercitatus varius]MDG2951653.1 SDR family NAD(P)-dependent oxidoreductase [Exercitatus varius]QOF68467.1 SDR family NAD(P)-dependent oxidoreductase [Actinobacillus sp. GY-402]